jgi:hypothetical protein
MKEKLLQFKKYLDGGGIIELVLCTIFAVLPGIMAVGYFLTM